MRTHLWRGLALLVVTLVAAACEVDTIPYGLRATPPGDGPVVKFDLTHRPLPELPLPNDVGTFPDPTSRTGIRINASLVAPTGFEQRARADFATMEGWGTSAPISVAFAKQDGADPREAAIDLDDVARRMQGHDYDLSDDPLYVIDLTTGRPVFLDVGNGMYPVVIRDTDKYGPNDPKANESNLAFETVEEGPGLPQSAYHPSLDKDFDGVLDHPNTLGPATGPRIPNVDNLLTWYERETDTLIVRPVVPLEQKREYAVVLTDRLRGPSGKPVRSPFASIHHPQQRAGVQRLGEVLADRGLSNWYGDIAGTGLAHVAFAWTFTTQPTHEDLKLLRDGLYGQGPFARFAKEFPADLAASRVGGTAPADEAQPPGWETSSPTCRERAKKPFVLDVNAPDIKATLRNILGNLFGLGQGSLAAVETAMENVDHVVVGKFETPFLMGDPASKDPDTRFHVDFKTGEGDVRKDTVQFFLSIPKNKGSRKAPFPVAFWGHGVTGHADEILFYAGDYARQGIALFAYNNPGHGLVLGDGDRSLAVGALSLNCITPFVGAIETGRAHDLDGDGRPDSGRYWWTAHVMHTRDNVRQGILDGMQALRILRSMDGRVGGQDYNGDGKPDVLGDFDGDGVVDAGGPNVPYFAAGESLGGVMASLQGGIEPHFVASAPMSGGGTLAMDVAFRSYGVAESVMSQLVGPIVFAVPANQRTDAKNMERMGSRCQGTQRSLRIVVNQHISDQEMEIACLDERELGENMTVVVTNVSTGEARCARTGANGTFRAPIPTTKGDRLDVQIYTAPDVVRSYDGCEVTPNAPVGRRVQTWEQAVLTPYEVADATKTKCDEPLGCAQFRDVFYPVGSPLVSPNDGLGLRRQSPALRRYRDLAQAAFDPGDPVNFAPYYMLKPQIDETGKGVAPHALLVIDTVGDNFVPVAGAMSFARAAGALPFLPPTAADRYPEAADYATPRELFEKLGRKTPMQFLIETGVVDGIPRLGRTKAGPACAANYRQDAMVCKEPKTIDPKDCAQALFDADWVSEGGLPYDQPHPDVPLRLARVAGRRATNSQSLASAWEPRLRGVPFAPDDTAWSASDRVIGLWNAYLVPEGKHTWDVGDTCRKWDFATYGNALTARFFATEGRDLYYLSHPRTHGCLATGSCEFLR